MYFWINHLNENSNKDKTEIKINRRNKKWINDTNFIRRINKDNSRVTQTTCRLHPGQESEGCPCWRKDSHQDAVTTYKGIPIIISLLEVFETKSPKIQGYIFWPARKISPPLSKILPCFVFFFAVNNLHKSILTCFITFFFFFYSLPFFM